MTPLRRRMIEDMLVRNFSPTTQRSYVHYVAEFARHYNASPDRLGLEHVRAYQVYLAEQRQLSAPSINTFVSAVQFLYTVTLEMPWGKNRFLRMKVPEKLPVVLSREEVERLFHYVGFLAHRAGYGSGLRIPEAVSLKPGHIDSARMLIRVEQGKGAKEPLHRSQRPHAEPAAPLLESAASGRLPLSRGCGRHTHQRRRHSGSVPGRLPHGWY